MNKEKILPSMHPQPPAQAAFDVPPLQGVMAHNTPGGVFDALPLQDVMAYPGRKSTRNSI